jgi:secreted Zn-dependent insulinase-like peptidase
MLIVFILILMCLYIYYLHYWYSGVGCMRGIKVRVLSKRFAPCEIEAELAAFLTHQRKRLNEDVTDEEVRALCGSIMASLKDPPTTYAEEAGEFWATLLNDQPFDWLDQIVEALRGMSRDDVVHAANTWLFDSATRKTLSTMIFSPKFAHKRMVYADAKQASRVSIADSSIHESEIALVSAERTQVLLDLEHLASFKSGLNYLGEQKTV